MKIATLQYSYDFPKSFGAYEKKIKTLVGQVAASGGELLLFPEYAGFEIENGPSYLELFQNLSHKYQIYICSGTQIVATEKGTFNRSYFFSPNGTFSHQDKCMLTPYEVEEGILSSGDTLTLFETKFGKVGICICYDVEFPKIAEMLIEKGAQLLLVPSYTSSLHGFYRVFVGCRARALEHQCYVVQSALVGQTDVEMAFGRSTVCTPIDDGFPEDGVLAIGALNQVEIVFATLDFAKLEKVRSKGQTRNYVDSQKLKQKHLHFRSFDLR
jgi:predicted amidohydrolase